MADWKVDTSYERDQVKSVIESVGLDVVGETYTALLCYCPFHHNYDTPAFAVNSTSGLYICFNASCRGNEGGSLVRLVAILTQRNYMEAQRYIAKKGSEVQKPLDVKLKALENEVKWPSLPQMKIDELVENLWENERALEYLRGRHFTDETIRYFEVGFDPDKDMVTVPVHDSDGNPLGLNGRSIEDKRFKLTRRLPRNEVLFNMHRAKRHGSTVIVCESQFDAMRIHQAGFPNVVCFLGSHISARQASLLVRYSERVIIMTDADAPGRKMGHTLAAQLRGMSVQWAIWDWGVVYPHDAKDAGDMTDEEIAKCIKNSVSHLAYSTYRT